MTSGTHSGPRLRTETLIVSDLHLGSRSARVKEFLELLHTTDFKRLILLGDIIHSLDFHRMEESHWHALGRIRGLTRGDRGKEVIWIAGNHDWRLKSLFTNILGVEELDDFNEYTWTAGGKKFLAVHGHKFDYLYGASKIFQKISEYGTWIDGMVHFPKFIRRLSQLTHMTGLMEQGSILRARFIGAQTVFCGHTHKPKKKKVGDVTFINTGSFVHTPCTFATVSADGVAELHEFSSADIDWNTLVGSSIPMSSLSE